MIIFSLYFQESSGMTKSPTSYFASLMNFLSNKESNEENVAAGLTLLAIVLPK